MRKETLANLLTKIPSWVIALVFIGRRPNVDGTRLNAKAQLICKMVDKIVNADDAYDIDANREQMENLSDLLGGPAVELASVKDIILPLDGRSLQARLYKPDLRPDLPTLLYFHGGGYIRGSLNSHDRLCRNLSLQADCAVLSVAYRLAPEYKFPAAVEDAFDSLLWLQKHGSEYGLNSEKTAVGGDSSGGNLATVACQLAKENQTPMPLFQLLLYPSTNSHFTAPSHKKFARGYFLTAERLHWFRDCYLEHISDRNDMRASPDLAENVRGLPPALLISAGYDPLRDEAEEYAQKLKAADVPVGILRYGSMVHGFISMPVLFSEADEAISRAASTLKSVFSG